MFVIIFIQAADSGPRLTIVTNAPVPANIIRRDAHGAAVLAAALHTEQGPRHTNLTWTRSCMKGSDIIAVVTQWPTPIY